MFILKDANNKEVAYNFLDFIIRSEIAAKISGYLMIPSPIAGAAKYKEVEPVYTLRTFKLRDNRLPWEGY
ncbi:hypothetical protein ACSFC1_09680 [Pseudothermotoga sp. U03pept]|uniref:hypothetical protein n=1 Tax=Pseudothermotoga sp. U03pept TaxID=3447012 RepID=UPI003F05E9C9